MGIKWEERLTMATQGTTADFMTLLLAMKKDNIPLSPPGKILFIYDQPGVYQKALGIILDNPNGGMDAPLS